MNLVDILRKKGMIEILMELHGESKTFTQIMNTVRLSMSNVVARLREAEAYGLIKRIATVNKGKIEVKYILTEKGSETLKKITGNKEINETLDECRYAKKKVEEIEKKLYKLLNEIDLNL